MKNALGFFTKTDALVYAHNITRVSSEEYEVQYERMDVCLDVQYKLRRNGFVVCLDIRVIGDHQFWIQGNCEATDEDKIFWSKLTDRAWDLAQEDEEVYKNRISAICTRLAEGFPD
jgi:hypothetical protein